MTSLSDFLSLPDVERTTETRTFTLRGVEHTFTIYTDGAADAERWLKLKAAAMDGQVKSLMARANKQEYKESIGIPGRKPLIVTDPAYIGALRVLAEVLVEPKFAFGELMIVGHKVGKDFTEVLDWAADANGISEDAAKSLMNIIKNANSPEAVSEN